MNNNNNIMKIFTKPISNEVFFLGILGCIMAMIPIILIINNYAYKNGKLVCDNYVLNSYLYTLLGFCIIGISVFVEQKYHLIFKLFSKDIIIRLLGFILFIGLMFGLSYYINNANPNNFIMIHLAYVLACFIFGLVLSIILIFGYYAGVLYTAIIITISLVILMGFIGYKYGHLFINYNFDKILKNSLIALIFWSIIAPFIIKDYFILTLVISIPSAIIFCLLLMSYNNKLRNNQKDCKVPNYPKEALGLVTKIGNLLADIINLILAMKSRRKKYNIK